MDICERVHEVGGDSGGQFSCCGGSDGKILQKIEVWVGGWQIRGIRVWLTGSDPQTFGQAVGASKEFSFEAGERITKLSLWDNGLPNVRAGGIYFETDRRNRSFDYGMTEVARAQEHPIDVASGVCVGVQGRCGLDLDNIGFVFLKPIASALLKNVTYPTLKLESHAIMPETLDVYRKRNSTANPLQWDFRSSREVTLSSSWSITEGLDDHIPITVEAGLPEVVSVGVEAGWKITTSGTHHTTTEKKHTLAWDVSGTLGSGERVSLKAVGCRGVISTPYEGKLEFTLESGDVYSYPMKGQYTGVSYGSVEVF